jgi:hypothetical protein
MNVRGTLLLPCAVVLLHSSAAAPQQPRPSPAPARPVAPSAKAAPRAKATPAPPPFVEGIVRGPDRKPLEKALVLAVADAGPTARFFGVREPPSSTRTGPDGRFRLTLRAPKPQTVRVEAAGLAAQTRKGVSPGASLAFDLARGGTIEGVVRDGETGQPVPRARVEARGGDTIAVPDDPGAGRVVTETAADGRFKLEGLATGLHTVVARSRMAGFASRSNLRAGARVELLVFPAATVSGTVTGADGKPVPRVVVSIAGRPFGRNSLTEAADDLGRYELNGLDAGLYDVIARAPGMAPALASEIALDRRSDARVDLVLRPGARVVGRLVDANERALKGRVSVGELDGRATPMSLADSLRTEAQADGRFAIEGVPVGEHALGVVAPGQAPERVEFAVRAGDRRVDVGDVRLEVGLAIRGRVRTKQGGAVADATVHGFAMRRGARLAEATTEADGSFVLAGLDQALYSLSVQAPGYGSIDKQAEPGGEPVDLVLEPAGSITGQVTDDRGKPIESFRVTARSNEGMPMRRAPRSEEVTSEDGRFSLGDLAAGTYVLSVTAPERATGTVPGISVTAGVGADVGTVKLGAGGAIKGTVTESGGGPIAGARISVTGQGRDWMSMGTEPEWVSDAAGAFEVRGVAAGTVQVAATHPDFARSEAVTADVDPAKPPAEVRIVMSEGGRVEGSVRRRDGAPLASALVTVSSGSGFAGFAREASAATGADGRFHVENVRAGRASLMILFGGATTGTIDSMTRRDIEVREGETTNVDVVLREILVSGHVTRSGAPAAGLRIEAMGQSRTMFAGGFGGAPPAAPSGPQRMTAVTRDDGGYEMVVDEPGTIRLMVTSTDGRVRLPMRTAEVPDADAFTLDLSFAGVPVTGIVVDKETEAPIGYASVFARKKAGEGSGGGMSGADGRFQIEVEPGDYVLGAAARDSDYSEAQQTVSIGEAGLSDVRLALPKGIAISGKVTDPAGRAVGSIEVNAVPPEEKPGAWGWSQSLGDGTFRVTGLNQGSYTLVAQSATGAFALRPGIAAGSKNVALVLQPGGRVAVTAQDAEGRPLAGGWPSITNVSGLHVGAVGMPSRPTDTQGTTEMLAPAGELTVVVRKDKLRGTARVSLSAGETAAVTVTLEDPSPAR